MPKMDVLHKSITQAQVEQRFLYPVANKWNGNTITKALDSATEEASRLNNFLSNSSELVVGDGFHSGQCSEENGSNFPLGAGFKSSKCLAPKRESFLFHNIHTQTEKCRQMILKLLLYPHPQKNKITGKVTKASRNWQSVSGFRT